MQGVSASHTGFPGAAQRQTLPTLFGDGHIRHLLALGRHCLRLHRHLASHTYPHLLRHPSLRQGYGHLIPLYYHHHLNQHSSSSKVVDNTWEYTWLNCQLINGHRPFHLGQPAGSCQNPFLPRLLSRHVGRYHNNIFHHRLNQSIVSVHHWHHYRFPSQRFQHQHYLPSQYHGTSNPLSQSIFKLQDHSVNRRPGCGPPVYRISGELYHASAALNPPAGRLPRYAQLYVIQPQEALAARLDQNHNLDPVVMWGLQNMLMVHHPFTQTYRHAYQILQEHQNNINYQVTLRLTPGTNRGVYNLPTVNEVAFILPGTVVTEPRDIILRLHGGLLERISDLNPAYVTLQYPLLLPHGTYEWHPELRLTETEDQRGRRLENRRRNFAAREEAGLENEGEVNIDRKLTLSTYTAYRTHFRQNDFNTLLRGGPLFCRYVVDMYASVDQQRLMWIQRNQTRFRAARLNHLQDANMNDPDNMDAAEIGQRVFLPSSYIGGPRNMAQNYQDAMAIARFYGKVDIFLTMTTNPKWPEIERELLPGQTAYDRPDLVVRVFQLKKQALIDRIVKDKIFGEVDAYVYTIEFQKRGLPHMHLLLFLKNGYKLTTPDAIDSCISAQWPDEATEQKLFDTVREKMVHGPCGPGFPNAPCMVNGKCSKGFPAQFNEATTLGENGYARMARPNNGISIEIHGIMVDNRWIVAYPRSLCAEFDCHINMECAISLASARYTFKYLHKGPDRGTAEVSQNDEVKKFVDGRYISPTDAMWRIFHFPIHEQFPPVCRLQVHLPGQQNVVFYDDDNIGEVIEENLDKRTTLTAFFLANENDGPAGQLARTLTYAQFPQHFVWEKAVLKWKPRTIQTRFAIGRMYFMRPTQGKIFYLRTLLTVVKGPTSFDDLKSVPGHPVPFPTFYDACIARGLLNDGGEWRICLLEACEIQTGSRLRHLFVTLLLFGTPTHPHLLWNEFKGPISDDLGPRIRAMNIQQPLTLELAANYALFLIDNLLKEGGRSLRDFPHMPRPVYPWLNIEINPLIAAQLDYDHEQQQEELEERLQQLNAGQRMAYDCIVASIERESGEIYFLQGSGGTGKTFVYNTICCKVRSEGKIVLCVASSGIAALLIRGGRTAHSMFKIPVENLDEFSTCAIGKSTHRSALLCETVAIIWDEVGAQHRHAVEAVDKTLRDIRGDDRPFGGITTILGGDFLQTLPVVPKGSRADIVDATVQRSHLWDNVQILRLDENMRLRGAGDDVRNFAQWLLDVGHGRNMADGTKISFPRDMRVPDIDHLIDNIYPGIDSNPPPPSEYFLDRMILSPRNINVAAMNNDILDQMAGEAREYFSVDTVIHEDGVDPADEPPVSEEFLRSITSSSLPPGELRLKIGCPIICLRNLDPANGLCNGTRLIVTRMLNRVIEAQILGGDFDGNVVFIPRIAVVPTERSSDVTFNFQRLQFPVRLAFSLSINKAQGQTVRYVGLDLQEAVFSHGQLYVALSRVTAPRNVKILLDEDAGEACKVDNIVYPEVLM
ncbi:hypothetical protein H1R20_g12432, partial [Candolleomyces eurysporus]